MELNDPETDDYNRATDRETRQDALAPTYAERMLREVLPIAYRLNYVANRFTLALYDEIDRVSGLDRARFIAMLCLRETETATATGNF